MKFKCHTENPVNGYDIYIYNRVFSKLGVIRHKEFKDFFLCVNPIIPTPVTNSYLNWKIDPLLKQILRISQSVIHIGRDSSIDE